MIPNQLVLLGFSLLLILVFLLIFLIRQIKRSKDIGEKIVNVACFILIISALFLPLIGVFEQGIIPVVIYLILIGGLSFYFIRLKADSSSFFDQSNYRNFVILNLLLIIFNSPFQEVLPDISYSPTFQAEYSPNKGPEVYIDEAHNNLHTRKGLYATFSNLLEKDGYNVKSFEQKFTVKSLKKIKFLVISNALHLQNVNDWNGPVASAFTKNEIKALNDWVDNGGSLFFIADHIPFGEASADLALSFGFNFSKGSVIKLDEKGVDLFSRNRNTLISNCITEGRNSSEFVDSIVTFTGQAIEIPVDARPILLFDDEFAHYSPETRKNLDGVKAENIVGMSQGAYMQYGSGRIVVFGEAAMFTGQLPAGLSFWKKIGMNAPEAKNNYKLLLNTMHWLDGTLSDEN